MYAKLGVWPRFSGSKNMQILQKKHDILPYGHIKLISNLCASRKVAFLRVPHFLVLLLCSFQSVLKMVSMIIIESTVCYFLFLFNIYMFKKRVSKKLSRHSYYYYLKKKTSLWIYISKMKKTLGINVYLMEISTVIVRPKYNLWQPETRICVIL